MPASETAARRRRAFDVRLLIGLALVVASVLGVVALVSAADARTPVYAASGPLSPGDRVDVGDLVERSVVLDGAEGRYLGEGDIPDGGLVVRKAVGEGELVPVTSVGSTAGLDSTSLVLQLSTPVGATVEPGTTVDVWSAAALDANAYGPPIVLASDAIVVRVIQEGGIVASSAASSVEVLVPRARVARLLEAIANGDALAVVPAGLGLEGR